MILSFRPNWSYLGEDQPLVAGGGDHYPRLPGYLSYGQLKLLPYWDPLRGDPRFEKIVASLAPK